MYGGVLRFNSRLKGKLLAMRILIGMYNFLKSYTFFKVARKGQSDITLSDSLQLMFTLRPIMKCLISISEFVLVHYVGL